MRKIAAPILFPWLSKLLLIFGLGAMLTSCVAAPPPYEDYTLARAAIRAAQEVDSPRFATAFWNQADDNYRNGQKAYRNADFDIAKKYFKTAIVYAEKAENATRLKKFQTGESFP